MEAERFLTRKKLREISGRGKNEGRRVFGIVDGSGVVARQV